MVARTTKVTIFLIVFVCFFQQPLFDLDDYSFSAYAPRFGAQLVHQAWGAFRSGKLPREHYERALLWMVYYLNWHAHEPDCRTSVPCGGDENIIADCDPESNTLKCLPFSAHTLVWIGFRRDESDAGFDPHIKSPHLTNLSTDWNDIFEAAADAHLPLAVREKLSNPWPNYQKGGGADPCRAKYGQDYPGYSPGFEQVYIARGKEDSRRGIDCVGDLRFEEREPAFVLLNNGDKSTTTFKFVLDRREFSRDDALWNAFFTAWLVLLLVVGAAGFLSDADVLVVQPLDSLRSKVQRIHDNPMIATVLGQELSPECLTINPQSQAHARVRQGL